MALPLAVIISYALPASTFAAVGIMTSMYLPGFYADHMGVQLSHIGVILTILQVFDAVTDPLVGYVSDSSESRFGRRKPFVALGSVTMAAVFIALFTPPRNMASGEVYVFMPFLGMVLLVAWTTARLPWMSWGVELTSAYDEKTKVSLARELTFVIGAVMAAVVPMIAEGLMDDEFQRLSAVAIFWAVLICLVSSICCVVVPDEPPHGRIGRIVPEVGVSPTSLKRETSRSLSTFLCQVIRNRTVLVFYSSFIVYSAAMGVNTMLFPFFVRDVLGHEELMSGLLATYIGTGALFLPAWYKLSLHFEKKHLYIASMGIQTVCLAVNFMVGEGDVAFFSVLVVLAGSAFGGVAVLKYSMLADVADVECLSSGGFRDEGKLFGLIDVTTKLVGSGATAVCFMIVDAAGYVEGGGTQGEGALLAIRVCHSLVPVAAGCMAMAVSLLYQLDRAGHAVVLAQLTPAVVWGDDSQAHEHAQRQVSPTGKPGSLGGTTLRWIDASGPDTPQPDTGGTGTGPAPDTGGTGTGPEPPGGLTFGSGETRGACGMPEEPCAVPPPEQPYCGGATDKGEVTAA